HLPGVANPNNVTSPTAVISVRGTIFEVIVEDLEGTTFISLDEGLVQVHHRMQPGPDRFLNPGESVRVFPNQALGRVLDKGNFFRNAIKVAEQAIYEVVYRRGSPGAGVPGSVPSAAGAQGDKGKNPGSSGSGGAPVPPGSAPVPP